MGLTETAGRQFRAKHLQGMRSGTDAQAGTMYQPAVDFG
jgi:hypothetical protein